MPTRHPRKGDRRRPDAGIDLATLTSELEREGSARSVTLYHQLLDCIERKLAAAAAR